LRDFSSARLGKGGSLEVFTRQKSCLLVTPQERAYIEDILFTGVSGIAESLRGGGIGILWYRLEAQKLHSHPIPLYTIVNCTAQPLFCFPCGLLNGLCRVLDAFYGPLLE